MENKNQKAETPAVSTNLSKHEQVELWLLENKAAIDSA
jgi:hypothetical protein